MDLSAALSKLHPIILKFLTGLLTFLLIKLLPKVGIPLTPDEVKIIAGFGATIILGIGVNWAAKTHATIMSADSPAPTDTTGGVAK